MSLTNKMLEDCYSVIIAGGHKSHERTFIMSWNQFQIMYGEQGERLRESYEVVDVHGRAQVQPKQLTATHLDRTRLSTVGQLFVQRDKHRRDDDQK